MPDDIWSLSEDERRCRAKSGGDDFWRLDHRYFVRCLLPVPIPGDEFRFGLWVEVDEPTAEEVWEAWDRPDVYASLRFSGKVANALPLAHEAGCTVTLATRDATSRPFVVETADSRLTSVMNDGWSEEGYLTFAQGLC